MKNLLTAFSSLAVLSLSATGALAHTGHLLNETVHGFFTLNICSCLQNWG